ncbi:polyprenyl synthetase family protein [Paenarthrobacter sp. A20]|uniref:polyprenyl synthetase family protein n=1 Tax=Paenarthrobacter sp. A20 TaxID=2817891 RepID=UPI0020A07BB9|nr:polyprenyl synthetase family protein [Paenarthrobacter sp. A20]MCP1412176.1 geranylgeranyl pyrophosphate synthase [Paenarthrobacter sp. A20]
MNDLAYVGSQVRSLIVQNAGGTGSEALDEILGPVASAGKMLRSGLILDIGATVGAVPSPSLLSAAAAVELLHAASLIHDDLIDGSDYRRDAPAVHVTAGEGISILSGDLLLARGMKLAHEAGPAAASAWQSAFERLTLGQLAESRLSLRSAEQDFLSYISMKTAELFAASCEMGALVLELSPSTVEQVRSFGWNFGMAFQLLDDLLDLLGDDQVLGKPVETDLPNGVFGVAAIRASTTSGAALEEALEAGQFSKAYELLRDPDVVSYCLGLLEGYVDASAHSLECALPLDNAGPLVSWTKKYFKEALEDGMRAEYRHLLPLQWGRDK